MKLQVTFEVSDETAEEYQATELHERLCLAIHEGNVQALAWLHGNVVDISFPTEVYSA